MFLYLPNKMSLLFIRRLALSKDFHSRIIPKIIHETNNKNNMIKRIFNKFKKKEERGKRKKWNDKLKSYSNTKEEYPLYPDFC